MRILLIASFSMFLVGCASTSWTSKRTVDEFTDKASCKVTYGSDFSMGFNKGLGGIHYYPFIEKTNSGVIFGVKNDYNIPVGDVQIRVDNHKAITISYTETPVFYSATNQPVDFSYLKNIQGVDKHAMQSSIDATLKNVQKISSPFTATFGEKAKKIIAQMKSGSKLKLRVIGFRTNSLASSTGEYILNKQLTSALASCGL